MTSRKTHDTRAVVADLAWAVTSPPLLLDAGGSACWFDDAWYRQFHAEIAPAMQRLEDDPAPLVDLVAAEKDRRLGNYFETLWHQAIELHPRYQLEARNLQVTEDGRTAGEFDFIVLDTLTGEYLHWELAIKFYLGSGDLASGACWHGQHRNDTLSGKLEHLLQHQLQLRNHPLARAVLAREGLRIDRTGVIIKGCLFYPWRQVDDACPVTVNSNHQRGIWMTRSQFNGFEDSDALFRPLIRSGWMSRIPTGSDCREFTASKLLARIDRGEIRLPILVDVLQSPVQRDFWFIVDDDWVRSEA